MYDRDNSGTLSTLELRSALHAAGYRLNYTVLNALVLRYGNRVGTLGFDGSLRKKDSSLLYALDFQVDLQHRCSHTK